MKISYKFWLLSAIALLLISGCSSKGAQRLPGDRFDYNAAISASAREQMLLNIVRSRYQEMPVFLEIGSVVAQYAYTGTLGLNYLREFINNPIAPTSDTAAGEVNYAFSERPTITYQPIAGEAFAKHLYSEVPIELILGAAHAGWAVDLMMLIAVERFGTADNMSFGEVRSRAQRQIDIDQLGRFARVIELLFLLIDRSVIEVQQVTGDEMKGTKSAEYLVISDQVPEDLRPLLSELGELTGIAGRERFQITTRTADLDANELSIQTRSVMAMMKFLARGIKVPTAHIEQGWVVDYGLQTFEGAERLFPFRMHSSKDRPNNAFAAVRYLDHWFYIANDDLISKRALEHVMIFFQLRAPTSKKSAPLLTLPTR